MTHRDVALGREIVARWCNLAERRLEYLTELWETGRWRRFHSEIQFLQNIQEAKAAVETWRGLLHREASLDNNSIDLAWLGRRRTTPLPLTPLPRDEGFGQPVARVQPLPQPAPKAVAPPRDVQGKVAAVPESPRVVVEQAPPTPSAAVVHQMPLPAARKLDAVKERYPLLRNAM
jgi:uncharacterized repeat protein (TIGR03809 family)